MPIEAIEQRDGRWCVVDLEGKGNRIRTVPIPSWGKAAVDAWLEAAGYRTGLVLGTVNKARRITGQGMTAQAVYGIVRGYHKLLGVDVAPHGMIKDVHMRIGLTALRCWAQVEGGPLARRNS